MISDETIVIRMVNGMVQSLINGEADAIDMWSRDQPSDGRFRRMVWATIKSIQASDYCEFLFPSQAGIHEPFPMHFPFTLELGEDDYIIQRINLIWDVHPGRSPTMMCDMTRIGIGRINRCYQRNAGKMIRFPVEAISSRLVDELDELNTMLEI